MLIDLRSQLERFFPGSVVALDMSADPDVEYMVAYVCTNGTPQEAIEQLQRFDDVYWLDHYHQAQGKLIVNVEFE